ncbi:MAG: hypothetical protein LBP92_11440 [Deltaproteobacteria bacterium]|jgi:hypothetical protein|nr:hypothetical protein [Deltaproteobacteria bacterium]
MRRLFLALAMASFVIGLAAAAQAQQEPAKTLATGAAEEGYYCGYYPSESGDGPGVVSIKMDQGLFNFQNGMQTQEEYDTLSELPVGSPIRYDFSVIDYYHEGAQERLTHVFLDKFHGATGEPRGNVCPAE